MLKHFLGFLQAKGQEAKQRAEAMRIRLLEPPEHYKHHRPPHIPDPAPDKLPWKEARKL